MCIKGLFGPPYEVKKLKLLFINFFALIIGTIAKVLMSGITLTFIVAMGTKMAAKIGGKVTILEQL